MTTIKIKYFGHFYINVVMPSPPFNYAKLVWVGSKLMSSGTHTVSMLATQFLIYNTIPAPQKKKWDGVCVWVNIAINGIATDRIF